MKTIIALSLLAGLATLLTGVQPTTAPLADAPAKAFVAPAATPLKSAPPGKDSAGDAGRAREALAALARKYRHLEDVSVTIGRTPGDEQAVAYYTEGEIVISPAHSASIEKILAHEIWHVIDWRDNGQLDWGENLPPAKSAGYLRR